MLSNDNLSMSHNTIKTYIKHTGNDPNWSWSKEDQLLHRAMHFYIQGHKAALFAEEVKTKDVNWQKKLPEPKIWPSNLPLTKFLMNPVSWKALLTFALILLIVNL